MSDRADLEREFQDKEYREVYYEDALYSRLALQLVVLRRQRGWTQEELAQRAGMKQERISVLEDVNYRGWTLSTLNRLARAFDVALGVGFIPFAEAIERLESLSAGSLEVDSGFVPGEQEGAE